MKAFKALTLMIETGDAIAPDVPQELRGELADIVEELIAMRNRHSQMCGIQGQLPTAEELEAQG